MAGPKVMIGSIAHMRSDRVPVNVAQQLQKMIMVRHQAKCSNPEIKHLGGFP
jgi:hypothetical protein